MIHTTPNHLLTNTVKQVINHCFQNKKGPSKTRSL